MSLRSRPLSALAALLLVTASSWAQGLGQIDLQPLPAQLKQAKAAKSAPGKDCARDALGRPLHASASAPLAQRRCPPSDSDSAAGSADGEFVEALDLNQDWDQD